MRALLIISMLWLGAAQISSAQDAPQGLGDILQDILNGMETPAPQTPIGGQKSVAHVDVTLDLSALKTGEDGLQMLEVVALEPDPSGLKPTPKSRRIGFAQIRLKTDAPSFTLPLALPLEWAETYPYLMIDAAIRDENDNLIAQSARVGIYRGKTPPRLTLNPLASETLGSAETDGPLAFEQISGKVTLSKKELPTRDSRLYVQLLENALAGGTSISIAAERTLDLPTGEREIDFTLERAVMDGQPSPDLGFKVWIADWAGRKTHVLKKMVSYNGPETAYEFRLDALRQGEDTKRGRNLNPDLMAQAIVRGEAIFDPSAGIPGQARLKIKLIKDAGRFDRNPVLSEQTLLLHGMETRIPFSLTTESTHFDPFIPAPYLSVSLTDSRGQVYYSSGDIRASEGQNFVRLYPR